MRAAIALFLTLMIPTAIAEPDIRSFGPGPHDWLTGAWQSDSRINDVVLSIVYAFRGDGQYREDRYLNGQPIEYREGVYSFGADFQLWLIERSSSEALCIFGVCQPAEPLQAYFGQVERFDERRVVARFIEDGREIEMIWHRLDLNLSD